MSFGIGDANKRPGIFESFRSAMAPRELPPDDGLPLTPPPGVKAATIIAMLAGLALVIFGAFLVVAIDGQIDNYKSAVQDCRNDFGGVGPDLMIPAGTDAETTAEMQACQAPVLTDDDLVNVKTANIVFGVAFVVLGIAAAIGGWFIRQGRGFGRLIVGGVVVLMLLMSFIGAQSLIVLVATLLLIVSVMLCFIGKGQIYFARIKARRAG